MWFQTYLNTHPPRTKFSKHCKERSLIITNSIAINNAALYSLKRPSWRTEWTSEVNPSYVPVGKPVLRQPRLLPAVSDREKSQTGDKPKAISNWFEMCSLQLWVFWEGLWGEGVHICLTVKLLCKSKLVYVYWTHATWQRRGWGRGGREAASIHMCWSSTKTENWLEADDPPLFFSPKTWVGIQACYFSLLP